MENKTANIYFDLVEKFSNEIEKEAQDRYPVNGSTKDLYIPSNAAFQHGAKYGLHLASLRSKELQEDLRVTENVKLSYLQAYNRECKRVDELTEEVANKQERIQELEAELKSKKYWDGEQEKEADTNRVMVAAAEIEDQYQGKIAELEGLLREQHDFVITRSMERDKPYLLKKIKAIIY